MTHRIRIIARAAAAALLAVLPAAAQVQLRPEQRIRILAPKAGIPRLTGATVFDTRADTLLVQTAVRDMVRGGMIIDQRAVPVSAIRRLDVRGSARSRGEGAARGGVVGLGVGLLAVALHMKFSVRPSENVPCRVPARECPFPSERRLLPYDRTTGARIVGASVAIGITSGALLAGNEWRRLRTPIVLQPSASAGVEVGGPVGF